jgi:cytochrome c peroxidase
MALHSPSLTAVAWLDRLGWDGKYRDIEAVTFVPLLSPQGMNTTEPKLVQHLLSDPAYAAMFARAFPGQAIGRRNIELALATYERAIVSKIALFNGKAKCAECHSGWQFTDGSFHDIGVAKDDEPGRGRYFASSVKLQHAFKTPTLRNAARRAPYMHDGSVATLEGVIDLYDKGGIDRPSRAEVIKPLGLAPGEKADFSEKAEASRQSAPIPPRA